MKTKIISFFSLKGGVGKTTSCANIAVALGKANLKILLIDFDTNNNLSQYFTKKIKHVDGIKKILENPKNLNNVINKEITNNVDLISSSLDSSFIMINQWKEEYEKNLIICLNELKNKYDLIFIDLSASWNLQNQIILSNSDSILWPIICSPFAVNSINTTLNAIRNVQTTTNPNLKIEGVFINFFDKRKNNMMVLYSEISKIFGSGLYNTIIPQDLLITKLQQENKTIVEYANWKPTAIAFCDLAQEIIEKIKKE